MSEHDKTVLVVDDDLDVADALVRSLRQHGYTVLLAHDGVEALEVLRASAVDVLLTDIDMPGMDGVTLAAHVREEKPDVVRILLTGNARLETALSAINRGEVHRYLTKPWVPAVLLSTLDDAFARRAELARLTSADHTARRLGAARDALEREFPGITQARTEAGAYIVEPLRLTVTRRLLVGSELGALLSDEGAAAIPGASPDGGATGTGT